MMKRINSRVKVVILGLFVAVSLCSVAKYVYALPIAEVKFSENWDSVNSEWDYSGYVKNTQAPGSYLYDFYLSNTPPAPVTKFKNISDPVAWEHWSDNATYIEWDSISGTGSEITYSDSRAFSFSADKKLNDLYYEVFLNDANGNSTGWTRGVVKPEPIPEPATMLILGVIGIIGLKVRKENQ